MMPCVIPPMWQTIERQQEIFRVIPQRFLGTCKRRGPSIQPRSPSTNMQRNPLDQLGLKSSLSAKP